MSLCPFSLSSVSALSHCLVSLAQSLTLYHHSLSVTVLSSYQCCYLTTTDQSLWQGNYPFYQYYHLAWISMMSISDIISNVLEAVQAITAYVLLHY